MNVNKEWEEGKEAYKKLVLLVRGMLTMKPEEEVFIDLYDSLEPIAYLKDTLSIFIIGLIRVAKNNVPSNHIES